jgi:hypothetical protein
MDGAQRVYLKDSPSGSLSEANPRAIFIALKAMDSQKVEFP